MKYIDKKIIRHITLLLAALSVSIFSGCSRVPSAEDYLSSDRITAWKNDVEFLQKTLPLLHKDLYFNITEEQFKHSMMDLKNNAEQFSDKQMEIAISEAVAAVGDTHTGSRICIERMYPFKLHWYSEGIYITSTDEEHKRLLYSRITAVNGIRIEEAARRITPLLAGSNDSWFKNQSIYYLVIPDVLSYYGISDSDQITLNLVNTEGQGYTVRTDPVSYEEYQPAEIPERKTALYKSRPAEKYWFEDLTENKTIYLNYSSCSQMRELPFEIFNKEFWSYAADSNAQKLVIDLRNNGGGSSAIFEPFIKKTEDSRFNSEGKLWVIIGKRTFSSAILNSLRLKKNTKAIFIGEMTGGEPNHYGEVKNFKLPNSEITVQYSTKYFHWYDEDVNTLEPDLYVEESFAADMEGRDPVLDYILNIE